LMRSPGNVPGFVLAGFSGIRLEYANVSRLTLDGE
jgi:hypothetical protein